MNVAGADAGECNQRRQHEYGSRKQDIAVRQRISEEAENPGRRQAAGGLEPLIAPEPLTQQVVADEAEAYGGNSRSEKTARNTCSIRATETGINSGQRAMTRAPRPTMTGPAATKSLFD